MTRLKAAGCEVDYLTASEGENSRYNPVHLVTPARTIFVTTYHSLLRDVRLVKKTLINTWVTIQNQPLLKSICRSPRLHHTIKVSLLKNAQFERKPHSRLNSGGDSCMESAGMLRGYKSRFLVSLRVFMTKHHYI